jgi:hypothetical protein
MADTVPAAPTDSATPAPSEAAPAPLAALKKGALVRLQAATYLGSLEAAASDPHLPGYVLEGPGEILMLKGEHAQVRWRRPVPDVWLRLDQLEAYPAPGNPA